MSRITHPGNTDITSQESGNFESTTISTTQLSSSVITSSVSSDLSTLSDSMSTNPSSAIDGQEGQRSSSSALASSASGDVSTLSDSMSTNPSSAIDGQEGQRSSSSIITNSVSSDSSSHSSLSAGSDPTLGNPSSAINGQEDEKTSSNSYISFPTFTSSYISKDINISTSDHGLTSGGVSDSRTSVFLNSNSNDNSYVSFTISNDETSNSNSAEIITGRGVIIKSKLDSLKLDSKGNDAVSALIVSPSTISQSKYSRDITLSHTPITASASSVKFSESYSSISLTVIISMSSTNSPYTANYHEYASSRDINSDNNAAVYRTYESNGVAIVGNSISSYSSVRLTDSEHDNSSIRMQDLSAVNSVHDSNVDSSSSPTTPQNTASRTIIDEIGSDSEDMIGKTSEPGIYPTDDSLSKDDYNIGSDSGNTNNIAGVSMNSSVNIISTELDNNSKYDGITSTVNGRPFTGQHSTNVLSNTQGGRYSTYEDFANSLIMNNFLIVFLVLQFVL